jgi:hypothetical protein
MGLLDGFQSRECLRGHGPMERVIGDWAMEQVLRMDAGKVFVTGAKFIATIYRCKTCYTLELVDEETRDGRA